MDNTTTILTIEDESTVRMSLTAHLDDKADHLRERFDVITFKLKYEVGAELREFG